MEKYLTPAGGCPSAAQRLKAFFTGRGFLGFVAGIAVIAVIAFVFFYPDASQGNVLVQHDTQQGIANGQETKQFAEATGETTRWTNSLFSGMPTFQISPNYESNSLFTWINTVMGLGLPSPSNLVAMMMIGFFILLLAMKMRWYLALIGAIAYGFSSYFIIIIGAGHIWKFITLAYIPPTIAGILLCYRGRYLTGGVLAALFAMLQIASNHIQMTYYFLFVIVGFAAAYLWTAIKEKRLKQWGIATGVLAVAGLLAVTANLPGLYNTKEYAKLTIRGGHSELTSPEAASAESTDGLDRDYITQYSYAPSETFSLLIPNIKGGASIKPEKGEFRQMSLASLPEVKEMNLSDIELQYLEYQSQYFGDPEGTNGPVYVGALIFALFLLGCVIVKGPVKWVLVVLTLFSIILAWGRHLMGATDFMIDFMPMYSRFRAVESILVIAEFTMPLLAMMALSRLVSVPAEEAFTKWRKPLIWTFGATLVICAAGIICPSIFGSPISERDTMIDSMITEAMTRQGYDQQTVIQNFSLQSPRIYEAVENLRYGMVESDSLRSFLIVGLGFIVLMLYMRRKLSATLAVCGVGLIVVADLFSVNKRYLDHDSFMPKRLRTGDPIAMTDIDRKILTDTTMNYRVMDIPRFNSAEPSYYHKMIGGYHAAKLTRYQDLIERHLANFGNAGESDGDWNVINMLNARYIVDLEGNVLRNPEALGNAWFVDRIVYTDNADAEMAALDRINPATEAVADKSFAEILGTSTPKAPGDTIYETTYAPNRLTYKSRSAKGGIAVFSEIYFPWGWNVTVDGQPVELGRVNYVLRALRLPAGEHVIDMRFDPPSLRATTTAAYIAIILIYLGLAAAVAQGLFCRKEKCEK